MSDYNLVEYRDKLDYSK